MTFMDFAWRRPASSSSRPQGASLPLLTVFRRLVPLWLLLLTAPALRAANIEVSLDRNPVPVNESFTLTFSADESPDGEPDFSPLQARFEVLNQSQSSQFSIVNGRATRRLNWQLQVMAKQAGTLDIPAIAFGSDRSRPFAVTVTHGAVRSRQGGEARIFLEADIEPKNPYVQAQAILTLRVLSRVAFSGDLAQPEVPDAVVVKLEDDREYVTLRDGVQFRVDERRYAVFPQKSGPLTIGPVNLTAQLGAASFGPFFRAPARQQRLHSDPLTVNVRPIPAAFTGKHWLPVASLDLSETWTPAKLEVAAGDPVTRSIRVQARGASVGMLPELIAGEMSAADLRQYPDQPVTQEEVSADGLRSQREQKIALMAARPGTFALPAVEIPWWNTVTDRMEVARLPERTLSILPAAGAEVAAPPVEPVAKPESPAPAPSAETASQLPPPVFENPWFWMALVMGAGWLLTGLAWWWRSSRAGTRGMAVGNSSPVPSEKALLRSVEQACKNNDPRAAHAALQQWARQRWPEAISPWVALLQCADPTLRLQMIALSRALYSVSAGGWTGGHLLDALKTSFCIKAGHDAGRETGPLEELNPI
ncbi:BatD family protein [Methyloparacoccus murrellii]